MAKVNFLSIEESLETVKNFNEGKKAQQKIPVMARNGESGWPMMKVSLFSPEAKFGKMHYTPVFGGGRCHDGSIGGYQFLALLGQLPGKLVDLKSGKEIHPEQADQLKLAISEYKIMHKPSGICIEQEKSGYGYTLRVELPVGSLREVDSSLNRALINRDSINAVDKWGEGSYFNEEQIKALLNSELAVFADDQIQIDFGKFLQSSHVKQEVIDYFKSMFKVDEFLSLTQPQLSFDSKEPVENPFETFVKRNGQLLRKDEVYALGAKNTVAKDEGQSIPNVPPSLSSLPLSTDSIGPVGNSLYSFAGENDQLHQTDLPVILGEPVSTKKVDEKPLRVLSFDFDGCMFNPEFVNQSEKDVLEANKALFAQIRQEKEGYGRMISFIGSNRQDFDSEMLNATGLSGERRRQVKGGYGDKGFSYDAILQISNHLGAAFDPFLLADVYDNLDSGTSHARGLQEIHGEPAGEHASWKFDDKKLTILYAQMHKVALENKHQTILFDFYDDKYDIRDGDRDIIDALSKFFAKYPQMIPQNVTLRLHHYNGSTHKVLKSIQGQGSIDVGYRERIKTMASLHKASINEPFNALDYVTPENIGLAPVEEKESSSIAAAAEAKDSSSPRRDKEAASEPVSSAGIFSRRQTLNVRLGQGKKSAGEIRAERLASYKAQEQAGNAQQSTPNTPNPMKS